MPVLTLKCMGVQYVDTSEHSDDVFYLHTGKAKIPLNLMSWGLAENGQEWTYRGALVIVSRVFDDELDSCHGEPVQEAMEDAFELFLERGGLVESELTKRDWERFRKGKKKLKRRFLKRQLRNGCYLDVMDALTVGEGAILCNWIYQQVVRTREWYDTLGEIYKGVPATLTENGKKAHDYARTLYNLFWNERIMEPERKAPKEFDISSLFELEGEYRMSFSPENGVRVNTVNRVLVSPEIKKLDRILCIDTRGEAIDS